MSEKTILENDVIVIGGGVVGTAIAHKLAEYKLRIALVEKGSDLASGTSKANSGIFHAPYNVNPETLKGRLHLRAMEIGPALLNNLHVPLKSIGALVVAYSPEEVQSLEKLYQRIIKLAIPDIRWIEREELRQLEPLLSNQAMAGILASQAGVISPYEFTYALGENAILNGVKIYLDNEVIQIEKCQDKIQVITPELILSGSVVINAAGLNAEQIAHMIDDTEFSLTARKGEYYLYDQKYGASVNHVLFPVPSTVSKGILVTPTIDGNLLIGPNAQEVLDGEDTSTTQQGLNEVFRGGQKVLPWLKKTGIVTQFAGVRSVVQKTEDFYIKSSKKLKNFIHVAGIQSPGLTAAPAIAEYVIQIISKLSLLQLLPNPEFAYYRKPLIRFSELSREEQAELIAHNPLYGQMICRCEQVTEAEIIDVLSRALPARTVGGVKRRARAGMGRCQGGFCGPKILALIAKHQGISMLDVTREGGDSLILLEETKRK